MANTADYLNELVNQKNKLAAALVAEEVEASEDETFNTLVEKAATLHNTDQTYNPTSKKAQSGIAVAEGIDNSVGDINGALSNLVEPSEIDPATWLEQTVDAAVEEIKAENEEAIESQFEEIKEQNETTISTRIREAVSNLSTENEKTIKQQVADAVDKIEENVRRSFLLNAKRVKDGNIEFKENTIYVVVRVPDGNTLTVYDCDTLEPVTISDRHYCIIVGNVGDDVSGAICATVLSYPTLSPQLYIVKNSTLQGAINWTGTAIVSEVKNELV